jgi:hypothetical protein
MATVRILDPQRELTVHLFRASSETNHADDIQAALADLGLSPQLMRMNPVTHDIWILTLDLTRQHSEGIGIALTALLLQWIKQTKNRRIEVQWPGLKVKVATSKELAKALGVLHNFNELRFTLNNGKRVKRATQKGTLKKRKSE